MIRLTRFIVGFVIGFAIVYGIFKLAPTTLHDPGQRMIVKMIGVVGALLGISLVFKSARSSTADE
jgi:hypothetical protein